MAEILHLNLFWRSLISLSSKAFSMTLDYHPPLLAGRNAEATLTHVVFWNLQYSMQYAHLTSTDARLAAEQQD